MSFYYLADALQNKQIHSNRRRDKSQLQIDQHHNVEPDRIEAQFHDNRNTKSAKMIKIMEIDSKIHPKTNSRILIAIKTIHRLVSISATRLVKACGTCRIVKTKPNKVAPIIIAKIIEVVLTVSSKISGISFRPSVR